jgi:D-beta-D-heptose 7-phosphate kinase/D-beta-D-heptose 1-phosphate adenosyltransferase
MKQLSFSKARVLVIGDVMLDRYNFGAVSRISPEAPVPVVRLVRESATLGGAANVAGNLAHLGAHATLVGLCGADEAGKQLASLARAQRIVPSLAVDKAIPTTTKTRILGGHQQMLRVDVEEVRTPTGEVLRTLCGNALRALASSHVAILSDYAKGVCCEDLCTSAIKAAAARDVRVLVDPKTEDWTRYRGAFCVTPNFKELCMALGRTIPNRDEDIAREARALIRRFRLGCVLVTRSELGVSLVTPKGSRHIHSRAQEVFDVSGAGDTSVATFAAALAVGFDVGDAVELANLAGGIVVGKLGTVPVELDELRTLATLHGIG